MRRLKVLIADDHELMLEAIRIALAQATDEFEVVASTSRGPQVLPLVGQMQPDIVVLDLRMPGMDGLTCLEHLRKRHPNVKAVVLSGVEDPAVVRSAFARGATAFIRKHIDPRDLPALMQEAARTSTRVTCRRRCARPSTGRSSIRCSERPIPRTRNRRRTSG